MNIIDKNKKLEAELCCDENHQSTIYSSSALPTGNVGLGLSYTITVKLNGVPFTPIVLAAGTAFLTAIPLLNAQFKALKAVFSVAPNSHIKGVITNPSDGFTIETLLA